LKPQRKHFRQRANYWIACGSEWLAPLWRALGSLLRLPPPTPPSHWRRGLLLGPNHIGDVLYLTPSLARLKEALPACQWDICVAPPAGEVLEHNPHLNEIISVPHDRTLQGIWRRLRPHLRGRHYDVVLTYEHSAWKDLLLALSLRIPNRVAYAYKGFSSWITLPLQAPDPYPQTCAGFVRDLVGQVAARVSSPGEAAAPDWPLTPQVWPGEEDEAEAAALWRELAIPDGQRVLLCFATSRQGSGVWPSWHILATLRELLKLQDCTVIWAGAAADLKLLEKLQAGLDRPSHQIAGRLRLRALACFMRRCRAVISTDSGPRHIANAAGVPVFFFRNFWFPRAVAGSYCPNECDLAGAHELLDPQDAEEIWLQYPPEQSAREIASHLD